MKDEISRVYVIRKANHWTQNEARQKNNIKQEKTSDLKHTTCIIVYLN